MSDFCVCMYTKLTIAQGFNAFPLLPLTKEKAISVLLHINHFTKRSGHHQATTCGSPPLHIVFMEK